LLPKKLRRFRYPGRKPFDDRLVLQGIFVCAAHRDRLGASAAADEAAGEGEEAFVAATGDVRELGRWAWVFPDIPTVRRLR